MSLNEYVENEHKTIRKVSCQDLQGMLNRGDDFTLIDVREPEEFEMCNIDGSILIPYIELQEHIDEFDMEDSYVLHCMRGKDSEKAQLLMEEKGFKDVKILSGGIYSWAKEIDRRMATFLF